MKTAVEIGASRLVFYMSYGILKTNFKSHLSLLVIAMIKCLSKWGACNHVYQMYFPRDPRSDQLVLSSQQILILPTVLKANSKAFQVHSLYLLQSLLSRASQFPRGADLLPDARTQYSLIGCLYLHPAWLCPLSSLDTLAQPPVEKRIAPRGGSDNCTHLAVFVLGHTLDLCFAVKGCR